MHCKIFNSKPETSVDPDCRVSSAPIVPANFDDLNVALLERRPDRLQRHETVFWRNLVQVSLDLRHMLDYSVTECYDKSSPKLSNVTQIIASAIFT